LITRAYEFAAAIYNVTLLINSKFRFPN
jgi:hypothetical protein